MGFPIPISPLPFKTDHPRHRIPYVTYGLMAINIFVYFSMVFQDANGTLDPDAVIYFMFNPGEPNFISLFTHAFMHADFFHLLGNMLLLWLVGTVLEEGLGSGLFSIFYATSMVVSVVVYAIVVRIFMPNEMDIPLIGASGAISGVMGLAVFRHYRLRVCTLLLLYIIPLPFKIWLPFWGYAAYFAGSEFFQGVVQIISRQQESHFGIEINDPVAHWVHIGGIGLGVLAALLLDSVKEGTRSYALEDAANAVKGEGATIPVNATMGQLENLLKQHPHDPEILEAMAALAMNTGNAERSRELSLLAISCLLTARNNERATMSYLSLLLAFPEAMLPGREQLSIASALEGQRHYREAAQAFELIVEKSNDERDIQTAMLRVAQLYAQQLNDPARAAQCLRALLDQYPASPWENLARQRLQAAERAIR